jgi:hypothetical protein
MKTTKSKTEEQLPPVPDYDLDATREKFLSTGRKFRPYAFERGVPPEGFARFLTANYLPKPSSKQERRYIRVLEEDGLLVLKKKPKVGRRLKRCRKDGSGCIASS